MIQERDGNVQNSDHGVPLEVVQRALLQEDVGLVDEHDGVPTCCDVEDPLERGVQVRWLDPEVAASHNIQRASDVLAGSLRGECLSHSGWTEEVDDEPLPLAADEVVEAGVGVVCLDERAE